MEAESSGGGVSVQLRGSNCFQAMGCGDSCDQIVRQDQNLQKEFRHRFGSIVEGWIPLDCGKKADIDQTHTGFCGTGHGKGLG